MTLTTKQKEGFMKHSEHAVNYYWKKTEIGENLVIEIPYGNVSEENRKIHERAHLK